MEKVLYPQFFTAPSLAQSSGSLNLPLARPLPLSLLARETFFVCEECFTFAVGGKPALMTGYPLPTTPCLSPPRNSPPDVLSIMPQLAAESFTYTRFPHALLKFVAFPPISDVLAPYSDKYKKDNDPETVHRNINRSPSDAFSLARPFRLSCETFTPTKKGAKRGMGGDCFTFVLPPVPPAPVQTPAATQAQTKAPPCQHSPCRFPFRLPYRCGDGKQHQSVSQV